MSQGKASYGKMCDLQEVNKKAIKATDGPAFCNTAIDMFGPLQIRVGRKTLKEAHAVIFTCMTTRAVHLALVTDRSTDTFLMAFRRFKEIQTLLVLNTT